jgi:hypothetical protein
MKTIYHYLVSARLFDGQHHHYLAVQKHFNMSKYALPYESSLKEDHSFSPAIFCNMFSV